MHSSTSAKAEHWRILSEMLPFPIGNTSSIFIHSLQKQKTNMAMTNHDLLRADTWGVSKNRGKTPKMDGENNGKPYFFMDDLGGKPTI